MNQSVKFPNSVQLFLLVRKVADDVFTDEPVSDAALGRMIGLEGARTSRWKYGQIAVNDAPRLLALSQALSINVLILSNVAAGYLSADEAIVLLDSGTDFLRFISDQLVLPQNNQAITLIDSDGAEARVVRNSVNRYIRKFRRSGSLRPISKEEQKRIFLLADDDKAAIDVFRNITGKGTGVEGLVASTLSEALLLAGKYNPHLVVMDIFLPGADGFETLRALSKHSDSPNRLIATSSVMTKDVIQKAKGCGAQQILDRPLRARALGKLVRDLING